MKSRTTKSAGAAGGFLSPPNMRHQNRNQYPPLQCDLCKLIKIVLASVAIGTFTGGFSTLCYYYYKDQKNEPTEILLQHPKPIIVNSIAGGALFFIIGLCYLQAKLRIEYNAMRRAAAIRV